jgi:hypothetical protein
MGFTTASATEEAEEVTDAVLCIAVPSVAGRSAAIEGVTPLLCNRFTDAAQQCGHERHPHVSRGRQGHAVEQATAALSRLGRASRASPAQLVPVHHRRRHVFQGRQVEGDDAENQPHSRLRRSRRHRNPIEHKDPWEVDARAVRIPSTGGRILYYRPSFNDWRLSFTLSIDNDLISTKLVREIIDAAGKRIGLGDFRPANKGPFGKFVVVSWQEHEKRPAG